MDPFLKAGISIDKKYVISLDHRQDRKDSAILEFQKAGVENVIFFPGFNTRRTGVIARTLKNPGTTGCYLSHQFLIHEAYANKYKNILIMEDDLQFSENFNEKFQKAWSEVPPNYDLVWIGSNEVKKNQSTPISDNVSIPGQVWGAHCYLISTSGINKIYNYLNSTPMTNHVDVIINNIPGLVQFSLNPSLCSQKAMGTDNMVITTEFFNPRNRILPTLKKQPQKIF